MKFLIKNEASFTRVDYKLFRSSSRHFTMGNVKQMSDSTIIYDRNNNPRAMIKAAGFDHEGRCRNTEYYLAAAC